MNNKQTTMKKPNKYHNASKIVKQRLAEKSDMVVPNEIYASKQLTSSEKWTMMSIYSFLDENRQTIATNQQIGEKIGLTGGGIGQRIGTLVTKGYITKNVFCTTKDPESRGNKIRQITVL